MAKTRVTVALDDDLLDRIDELREESYEFRSRTHFIEVATLRYLEELEEEIEEEE